MNSKKGFTLIELVVVIAILAILAAIAIPVVSNIVNTASLNATYSDARAIERCINSARADIACKNRETYGMAAVYGTISIAHVVRENNLQEACEKATYNRREIIPVWDKDDGSVVVVYADDYTEIQTGAPVANRVMINESETTLIKDLPAA